jgi:hypothetical protein
VSGYTTAHESRTKLLGDDRIDYPADHIEVDNRLTWFLPRLTERYGEDGVLVIAVRDPAEIANYYMLRWYKTNILKAYAQGILMRDFRENNVEVARDYVACGYEMIEFAAARWRHVVHLHVDDPLPGAKDVLSIIGREDDLDAVGDALSAMRPYEGKKPSWRSRRRVVRYALRNLWWDLRQIARR